MSARQAPPEVRPAAGPRPHRLGATPLEGDRCRFLVWAPAADRVDVLLGDPPGRTVPLERARRGYREGVVDGVPQGTLYRYRLGDGEAYPDPASRSQPLGVHGPSRVVAAPPDSRASGWRGVPLHDYILYELHVGTFTPDGTFDAAVPLLDRLADLGVTAVEVMPVAEFPGDRNWGYDGVYPFAPHHSYGGPEGFGRLVAACHERGLALVLDVVYNHLGPEGSYVGRFGPYFTDRYRTPWGEALNLDGPGSDEVRRYFVDNALEWVREYGVDALRVDAIHGIHDRSAFPFLEELAEAVHAEARRSGRHIHVIFESDLNDPRFVQDRASGGLGLDGQWNDDFHHALHALLTVERGGRYRDFGTVAHLETAMREGFVYRGQYSRDRKRRHGRSSADIPAHRFVVYTQNHDQVGNRPQGDRLSSLVGYERLKLAAAAVLLSPYIPLLFMGEEYGEIAPFPYFISHSDPGLVAAVRRGRARDVRRLHGPEESQESPDPQVPETFESARPNPRLRERGWHRTLHRFHRKLVGMRRSTPGLAGVGKDRMEVRRSEGERLLTVRRWDAAGETLLLLHFGEEPVETEVRVAEGGWRRLLDSADEAWGGLGTRIPDPVGPGGPMRLDLAPWSAVLLGRSR